LSREVASKKKKTIAAHNLPVSRLLTALLITKLKNKSNFKIGVAAKCRGVVECQTCHKQASLHVFHRTVSQMKPHVSPLINDQLETTNQQATSQDEGKQYLRMVKVILQDAMESPIFICEMAPLDSNDPCHDRIHPM